MGIYNCASTLDEALDSIYAQSFQDFEVILCDDGSSDNTFLKATEWADRHVNVVLLRNNCNQGLNITLNRCLSAAKGDLIARMDGDDLCSPERFEKEVRFLDEHPEYAIVSTPMYYFDDGGIFKTGDGYGEPDVSEFVKKSPFCHAPCMIRKEAFDAVGGYSVDKRLIRVEDYDLWIRMYKAGFKGYRLNEPLYYMRDDRAAVKRRTFQSRLNEAYVKHLAIKELDLPYYNYVHCLKPLILGILPNSIYSWIRKIVR